MHRVTQTSLHPQVVPFPPAAPSSGGAEPPSRALFILSSAAFAITSLLLNPAPAAPLDEPAPLLPASPPPNTNVPPVHPP